MPQTLAAVRSWMLPGMAPDVQTMAPSAPAMTWMFMPWQRCFPEK